MLFNFPIIWKKTEFYDTSRNSEVAEILLKIDGKHETFSATSHLEMVKDEFMEMKEIFHYFIISLFHYCLFVLLPFGSQFLLVLNSFWFSIPFRRFDCTTQTRFLK